MEVWFYHLESQPLARALPALIEKALARDWRVIVQTVDDLRMKALDDLLWTFKPESFLPHGTAKDRTAAQQPIIITHAADNPNAAALRIYVEGAEIAIDQDAGYSRVILLFDGSDEIELEAARGQWARLKSHGFDLAYWRQDAEGRWARQS